jgi:hypothetical protein
MLARMRERESPSPSLFLFFTIKKPNRLTHTFCFGACLKRIASVHGKLPHTPLFNFIVARGGIRNPHSLSIFSLSYFYSFNTDSRFHHPLFFSLSQICTLTHTQKFWVAMRHWWKAPNLNMSVCVCVGECTCACVCVAHG